MNQKMHTKKKSLFSQCIINEENDSFIIAKRFNNFTSIISPFIYDSDNNEYNSNFLIPHIRAHRIQSLYNLMPKIAKYHVEQNQIYYDCLHKLPPDTFNNYESGIIHFHMQNECTDIEYTNGQRNEIINVDIKLILNESDDTPDVVYQNNSKINFNTKYIKVFPVVLSKGFILAIANHEKCTLYASLLNPSKGYIGTCIRKEIANITQNIFPIWPIFNIMADEHINKILIKKDIMNEIKSDLQHDKVLLKLSYDFEDTSKIFIQKIGTV